MKIAKSVVFAGLLAIGASGALAQAPAAEASNAAAAPANEAQAPVANAAAPAADPAESAAKVAAPTPLKPEAHIGQPQSKEIGFQEQVTANGKYALWFHNGILLPLITAMSLFVAALMVYAMVRFRRSANPTPSKVSHNTLIEVIWTLGPVLILVGVAIPSIDLLAKQFKPAPKDALTVKVTGYQWYWGYEYPDNGVAEYVSNMLPPEKAIANGEPGLLGVDNRLVLPVGRPIKLLATGSDVIHSFSVPALWVKIDAVPGRINERTFTIDRPGVYYGQCSELCGARHGFMPIAIEALPPAQFAQWVASQGGSMTKPAEAAAAAE
ncbi:MAG: cytochrome c oxidase subunit II [Sphingobium sp.]